MTERTSAATAARIRKGQETMAQKLRDAGWTVATPEYTQATAEKALARLTALDGHIITRPHEFTAANTLAACYCDCIPIRVGDPQP